jgi:hypothetical protein
VSQQQPLEHLTPDRTLRIQSPIEIEDQPPNAGRVKNFQWQAEVPIIPFWQTFGSHVGAFVTDLKGFNRPCCQIAPAGVYPQ